MSEGWFVVLGTTIGFILSLCAFFIQQAHSRKQRKKKVRESLKFEMNTNWEIITTHKLPFKLLDSVLHGIIQSGDLMYFDKELHDFMLIYYRELSYHKSIGSEITLDTFEEAYPMFYQSFKNLRDKLGEEKK